MKRYFSWFALSALLLIALIIALKGKKITGSMTDYLSVTEQVEANILVVEGWLPDYAIVTASEEIRQKRYDHVITTGINSAPDFFNMHSNGTLVFYTKKWKDRIQPSVHHSIEINAYSELSGKGKAHFNVFINNIPAGDFLADKRQKRYLVNFDSNSAPIDSVSIRFDNDMIDESGDRNLYVKEITIDNKITIPYLDNSVYDMITSGGHERFVNNISSRAESARSRLLMLGIDPAFVTAVPAGKVTVNRTLTSALAFREWAKKSGITINGINIISMGTHARRTWLTYNRILGNHYKIGIISVPDKRLDRTGFKVLLKTLRETIGLLYYRIILLFY